MTKDLLDKEIDDGRELNKDYDAEDAKDAPREKMLTLGYGKAEVSTKDLVITGGNVFVPNAYDWLNEDGKKVSSGYFSFSALSTYRRCQRLFKYRYIDKIRIRQPAPKMWGGSAIHDAVENMLQAKINDPEFKDAVRSTVLHNIAVKGGTGGKPDKFSLDDVTALYKKDLPFSPESAKTVFSSSYANFAAEYAEAQARAIANGEPELPPVNWGARIESEQEFHVKFLNAVDGYIQKEYPFVNPKATEDCMIHHFPLDSGGTVPIVGFIDLLEETDFMSEYYNEIYDKKDDDMDPVDKEYALKVLKSIDNGELMITDHKCGLPKTYESARVDPQLTLYSLAKEIPVVAFDSIKLGTTGGKRPDRAKPAVIQKVFARRTQEDYERLTEDFNSIIKGISSGIYDKSGCGNMMVCSPTLCPFYAKCFPLGN